MPGGTEDWRAMARQGRFAEAEPSMLEETGGPDPYGDLMLAKAGFYEAWGDALRPSSEAIGKYRLAHTEFAWFASCATSGGEGTARMLDVNRVLRKIEEIGTSI